MIKKQRKLIERQNDIITGQGLGAPVLLPKIDKFISFVQQKLGGDRDVNGVDDADQQASHFARLSAYYAKHNPERGSEDMVLKTLAQYKGKVDKLWTALQNKYGEVP